MVRLSIRARNAINLFSPDTGGGGEDSLTNDPYSHYTSFHVNLTDGNDSNSGTTFDSPKRTIQAADALITDPASRILVRGNGALDSDVNLSRGGTSASAMIGISGYPDLPMPVITLGNFKFFPSGVAGNDLSYVYHRKMHLTGGNEVHAIDLSHDSHTQNFIAEFLQIDNLRRANDDNLGGISVDGAVSGLIVRYCKIGDNKLNSGAWYRNGTAILAYNLANAQIYNNEFYDCNYLIRWKEPPPAGQGPKIYRNIMRNADVAIGIHDDNGVAGGFNGLEVFGNLFYALEQGAFDILDSTDNSGFIIACNTVGHDAGGFGFSFMTGRGIRVYSNVFAGDHTHIQTPYYQNEDGNTPIRLAEVDYNSYFGGNWRIGEYLTTATARTYSSLSEWQESKTTHNHPSLSELEAVNPDLNSGSFSSLSDAFVDYENRDYTIKGTSSLKGSGKGGVDPGYDPTNIGPGW